MLICIKPHELTPREPRIIKHFKLTMNLEDIVVQHELILGFLQKIEKIFGLFIYESKVVLQLCKHLIVPQLCKHQTSLILTIMT